LDFGSDEGRLKITNQGFNFLETVFSDGLLSICQEYLRQFGVCAFRIGQPLHKFKKVKYAFRINIAV
jgi:hypothetical protein